MTHKRFLLVLSMAFIHANAIAATPEELKKPENLSQSSPIATMEDGKIKLKDTSLFGIELNTDEQGHINPRFEHSFSYGSHDQFEFGVGYEVTNYSENTVVDGFSDSKNAFFSTVKNITLDYFSYKKKLKNSALVFGLSSEYETSENNEFGYIHDSQNLFKNGADYYIAFDNNIDIKAIRHSIFTEAKHRSNAFITSISARVSPYSTLNVKQDTMFKPLLNTNGNSTSSQPQKMSYRASWEGRTNTSAMLDLGVYASYASKPVKYNLEQLATSNSGYVFEKNTIDTTEEILNYQARVYFKLKSFGVKPYIGYSLIKRTIKDNKSTSGNTTYNKTLWSIGIEDTF